MDAQATLRKLKLLATVREGRGFTSAEVECAQKISQRLSERIPQPDNELVVIRRRKSARSWGYWQQIAEEFGLRLRRFGSRGTIAIVENKHIVAIRADDASWMAQRLSSGGWETVARGTEPASLRKYMATHVFRGSMFASRE
jgi:hypothetical protein